jgi:hypothetical protein
VEKKMNNDLRIKKEFEKRFPSLVGKNNEELDSLDWYYSLDDVMATCVDWEKIYDVLRSDWIAERIKLDVETHQKSLPDDYHKIAQTKIKGILIRLLKGDTNGL